MRSRVLSLLLVLVLVGSILPMPVTGDTVIRTESVDLLPAGDFEDASEWTLTTNKAYSTDVSEYSLSLVADGHLSLSHNRPVNHAAFTTWASNSATGDSLATGVPDCPTPATDPVCDQNQDGTSDGGFAWSKGPVIELDGFDLTQGSSQPLVNVSLFVAFRIPGPLQQDSVRIIVKSGGTQHLVKTYAHTPGEVNHMQNNAKQIPLDDMKNWTWSDLNNITVMIDYVSVGEFDDSEVQVDAVGLWVKHLQPWGTFEMAKAIHSVTFDELPIVGAVLSSGSLADLTLSPCGLENSGAAQGIWISAPLLRPYDQSWGRFHPEVEGNASWKVAASIDGESWSSGTLVTAGELLPDAEQIRFEGTLFDGCIKSVRADINDPTVSVSGSISGTINSMVPDFAMVRIAMNGAELAAFDITSGSFSLSIPVGHLLDVGGGTIDIGISARFHWSSDGSTESVVVRIDEMTLDGGFLIEWDRDPVCENLPDQTFVEDEGGVLIDFLYTCSDDITANSNLVVTATSDAPEILEASFINSAIRLQPLQDAFGVAHVHIVVMDVEGNVWEDDITALIAPVDDGPEMDVLPVTLAVEIGDPVQVPFAYSDRDTPPSNLSLNITPDWVMFSGGFLIFDPQDTGTYTVTIRLSDDVTMLEQTLQVVATQRADVWVESVEIRDLGLDDGNSNLSTGDMLVVDVYVRNSGDSIAQPVTVRCSVNDRTIDNDQIAMISPGGLGIASCDWIVSEAEGEVELLIEIDWTGAIDETNEVNNRWSATLEVGLGEVMEPEDEARKDDSILDNNIVMWGALILLIIFGALLLQMGPGRIQRIQ
jgi:hypothetical protein